MVRTSAASFFAIFTNRLHDSTDGLPRRTPARIGFDMLASQQMRGSLGVSVGITALAVLIGFTGCGRKKHVRVSPPRVQPRIGDTEEGIASWYGHPYHGRQAADGEIYDMEKLVAAHRTLPFHTWVRV